MASSSPRRVTSSDAISSPLNFPSSPGGSGPGTGGAGPRGSTPVALTSLGSAPGTPLSSASRRSSLPRNDLGSARRLHQTANLESDDAGGRSTSTHGEQTVIWGTTVNVQDSMRQFRRFFNEFRDNTTGEPLYLQLLEQLKELETYNLNVDCRHLRDFDANLYMALVRYPQEVIPIFDIVIHELFASMFPDTELAQRIQVRTFNLESSVKMRDLNPSDINQLVSIRGMVTRTTNIIPDIKRAFFRCSTCNNEVLVYIDRGRIEEPNLCDNCNSRNSFAIVHNRCLFADTQLIKLQEAPEAIPEGETPQTVNLCAFDDLVDYAKPGDRVEVTGIYRANPVRVNPRQRRVKAIYRTYIDVIHFKKTPRGRMAAEDAHSDPTSEYYTEFDETTATLHVTEEREEELKRLSEDPNIYDKLVRAVAPGIYELDDVKRGILCQLFGGCNKAFAEQTSGKFRGEINILLCGDPGTSKSQLLQYVHKIAPRGIYTSGKGSSAVGLTAYITKDPDSGDLVLESGALVLSDRGICCIDEFDKMPDTTRSVLHEAMEQQTVSIAKAGIICTLNARTSILASANPRESRYNPKMSVVDNLQLPPTLLSRFDLIYLILDRTDPDADRRLAHHLINLYSEDGAAVEPDMPVTVLTDYISYARRNINPRLSDDSFNALVQGYVDMRSWSTSRRVVSATPRQLESLIRISESLARMRFSDEVTGDDVKEAIRLMRAALQKAAMDEKTGVIDLDLINTGISAATRADMGLLAAKVEAVIASTSAPTLRVDALFRQIVESQEIQITRADLDRIIDDLANQNKIVVDTKTRGSAVIRLM